MHKDSICLTRAHTTVQSTCNNIGCLSIKLPFLLNTYSFVGPMFNRVVCFIINFFFGLGLYFNKANMQ